MQEYRNSDMCRAIAEYAHNQKYRKILWLKFCEGYTYEEIAEETSFSPQHVKHICKTYKQTLLNHL